MPFSTHLYKYCFVLFTYCQSDKWKVASNCYFHFYFLITSKAEPPFICLFYFLKISSPGTSLVALWLRIRLPVQGTRVRALVQEDPTCCGTTKPMHHNYWACTLEPASRNYWACVPELLKPTNLEPVLLNKRSHHNEEPTHRNEEKPPLTATRESPCTAMKTQPSQK